jgi:prepilin peptidase CpaA
MAIDSQTTYMVAALVCASIATLYDLRTRRIPNKLTLWAIVCGLILHLWKGGPAELGLSALAGLIGGGIFLLFFMAGGMGGGDVKLMAAVGCLAGTGNIKDVLLSTVIIGAAMGIALALYRGQLRRILGNVVKLVKHHNAVGLAAHPEINVKNQNTLRLPYALPIAAGCLVTIMLASGKGLIP